jgi:hypothetical protein
VSPPPRVVRHVLLQAPYAPRSPRKRLQFARSPVRVRRPQERCQHRQRGQQGIARAPRAGCIADGITPLCRGNRRTGPTGTPPPDPDAAGLVLTALTGPLQTTLRTTKQRPFPSPAVLLSARLNRYDGRLQHPPGQPPTSRFPPTIGRYVPMTIFTGHWAGDASPVPAATLDTFRAP